MTTSEMSHLNRQIPPEAHTPMYLWHKYWSRKTWNVVAEFIKTYCREGGVVLDPFAGSGVTAMEALKAGRRAIVCDLNPIATEIIRLTIKRVNLKHLIEAFETVKEKVKDKIESLYVTKCRNCSKEIIFDCAIWENHSCIGIRYQACPYCGDRREENCGLIEHDTKVLKGVEGRRIREWYPTNRLYYSDGKPFKKKERYEAIDELFTKRNLQALAWLMAAIEEEQNKDLKDFLRIAFSSMVHLASKMMPVGNPQPTNHYTFFSSPGWTQHSYWYADRFMEQNVWDKFNGAISGHQGLIRAKQESNKYFENCKIGSSLDQVLSGKADIYIENGSCIDLMERIQESSVDYIFTDPPYDASIQFGELSYMWVSWLRMDKGYLDRLIANEIVRNERQQKDFTVYHSLLSSSFEKMFKVLGQGKYLTLTFHNPTFKVRNATIRAGVFAGFEFQKIHHQPLGQVSAKSMTQPFGSAQGDFYLRFHKPSLDKRVLRPEEIDELRFEKIVVETTVALLAERAEPTPYTVIINYVDPVLAKHGFFGSLHTGLDISTALKEHLNKEFVLVPKKVGGAEGKLWWFRDMSIVPRLNEVPLTERVERTVYRELNKRGRVTFTQVWDAVSSEFPNSLTSDATSIKDALEVYARQVPGGFWLLKPEIRQRVNQHTEIIVILASIGRKRGYDIWIGKREQSEKDRDGKPLLQYMTIKNCIAANARNMNTVANIDLLWMKDRTIVAVFEVESTTAMTEALLRGSNVDKEVAKFLVLPEEREGQLRGKLTSPLFKEHFTEDNWRLLYFDTLRNEYFTSRKDVDIDAITGKMTGISKKVSNAKQGRLC
jgi:16S rRNA G966 N2-methylase RsmD